MPPRRWPRRRPDPLGEGVWRRAHDRFRRAVDRYHQVLERVPAGGDRDALERSGAELAAVLAAVHAVCLRAQELAPSTGEDLPGGHGGVLLDVHRALARSATLAAQAAEAATLAGVALRDGQRADSASRAAAATRVVEQVRAQVESAGSLLEALTEDGAR